MFARILIASLLMLSMPACSLLAPQLDKAADGAAKLVRFYCTNVTVPEIRAQVREAVNAKASPHRVAVTCAGDESLPLLTPGALASPPVVP